MSGLLPFCEQHARDAGLPVNTVFPTAKPRGTVVPAGPASSFVRPEIQCTALNSPDGFPLTTITAAMSTSIDRKPLNEDPPLLDQDELRLVKPQVAS
jgi:hypothetical protein